jgi:hypothetical protein
MAGSLPCRSRPRRCSARNYLRRCRPAARSPNCVTSRARLDIGADLDRALAAVARGDSAIATAHLARHDAALATRAGAGPGTQTVLRARGRILALSEVLTEHAAYFDAGAPG